MTLKELSRRGFLQLGAAAGGAVLTASQRVHAAGSDVLKIGLVGCGGRGTGSLRDSLTAMPNVRVVALGDLFRERAVVTRAAIAASDVGKRIYGATRTAQNCFTSNLDVFHGTKGRMVFNATGIPFLTDTRGNERWRPEPKDRIRSMYVQEHYALVNSILDGKPINDGFRMANSTMVGVLGMIASFTGKRESYKELFESRFKIEPNVDHPSFDLPVASPDANGLYKIPVPGEYKVKTER